MPESRIDIIKLQTLILNEKEVDWLKALCQNKISGNEDLENEEMRKRFFNALKWSYEL